MENMVNMFEQLKQCYSGKRVFLTGHTGFKGAWLLKCLALMGAEVKGYALSPYTEDDLFNLIEGDSLCESIIADLRDRKKLIEAVTDFQPDFIFHLAAQPLVRLSYEIPSETFEINAIGTANLLDAVRMLEKECSVVLITTDKVYHNNEWEYPYRESDRLGGYDPYSASKACAELIIDSYRNSFFNLENFSSHKKGISVGRAGNVIGGGDWSKDRLIPDVAKAFSKGDKVKIRNPKSVRPWQHVLEPVVGYLLLGQKLSDEPLKFSQAFNFGPQADDALAVEEMINLAVKEWPGNDFEIINEDTKPHEAGLLKLDISKTTAKLGWKPRMNANKAVAFTVDWYKMFSENKANIVSLTEAQILTYLNA